MVSKYAKLKEKYEGMVFTSQRFGDVEVLEYEHSDKVLVRFIDTDNTGVFTMHNISRGKVKDREVPTVHGVGIVDIPIKGYNKAYSCWADMLRRCYDPKFHERRPTYKTCTVAKRFHKFSEFLKWCNSATGFDNEGWCLDKDILVKGNKIYSPNTCCFVPKEVNNVVLTSSSKRGDNPVGVRYDSVRQVYSSTMGKVNSKFLGYFDTALSAFQAYKQAKEAYIKEVAELYKDQIDIRVYEALMNYEVDIND